jgi:ribosomal protein S18 acetylase RimI-like enzyme
VIVSASRIDAARRRDRAARLLARAFFDDPVLRHIHPDDARRLAWSIRYFDVMVRVGQLHGRVFEVEDGAGVAIWLPPEHAHPSLGTYLRAGGLGFPLHTPAAVRGRGLRYLAFARSLRRRCIGDPHGYLPYLGVEPDRQGQGLGTRLLRPILAHADESGLPCYLETSTERTRALYRRHGFEVVGEGDVEEGGPRLWGMVRPAGG